jgi:hypothetical protein
MPCLVPWPTPLSIVHHRLTGAKSPVWWCYQETCVCGQVK